MAERNRALSELAELKARLTAQDIIVGTTATQAQQVQEPAMARASRTWGVASVFKGGALGAALLAGVEWLRRHREVTVALVVAGVAAVAAWLMWPDDQSPSGRPPVQPTVTVTETSVSSLTPPSTAAPTLTPSPGVRPSPTPRVTPTTQPTLGPTSTVMPVETLLPSPTVTRRPPTAAPTQAPTTTTPTTTEPTPSATATSSPTCRVHVVVLPGKKLIEVCVLRR